MTVPLSNPHSIDAALITALLGGPVTWAAWVSANPASPLDLRGLELLSQAPSLEGFGEYEFPVETWFDGVSFPGGFSFHRTKFIGEVYFRGCHFSGDVDFQESSITTGAYFSGAKFDGSANFSSLAATDEAALEMDGATFNEICSFKAAHLGFSSFEGANFAKWADFSGATIANFASFNEAIFKGGAGFGHATFKSSVTFDVATFDGNANFDHTTFATMSTFKKAQFRGGAWFWDANVTVVMDFQEAFFGQDLVFRAVEFPKTGPLKFVGATFAHSASFEGRTFDWPIQLENTVFGYPPSFHNTKLHPASNFTGTEFGSTAHYASEANFRTLKYAMHEQQDHRLELQFFAYEMQARAHKERTWGRKALFWLYRECSDYGLSIRRPVMWLMVTFAVAFLLYVLAIDLPAGRLCAPSSHCGIDGARFSAFLGFTLSQSLPFISLFRENGSTVMNMLFGSAPVPVYVQLIAVIQSFASIAFLFLIALGLRNLFRLS